MLHPSDTLTLAPGVRLEGAMLVDEVRGASYPANETARLVLTSGAPLASIAVRLADAYAVPREEALDDVLRFAWALNRALLANVGAGQPQLQRASTWLAVTLRRLPTGTLPPPTARRRSLDTGSWRAAVRSTLVAVRARMAFVAVAVALLAAEAGLVVSRSSTAVLQAAAIGAAAGIGLGLHEAAHAVALRGVRSGLVTAGTSTFVLHRRLATGRAALVALAGPSAPAALAAVLGGVAAASGSFWTALVACPLAVHALTATVAGRDGRTACAV